MYSDLMNILSKGKVSKVGCTHEPNNQAPWIFQGKDFDEFRKNESDTWFKIYDVEESTLPILNRLQNIIPRPKEFEIPEELRHSRFDQTPNKACNEYSNCSKEEVFQEVLRYTQSFEGRKIAMFKDVWVDSRGLIVNRQTCKAVRNGACPPADSKFELHRLSQKSYPVVISLATSWKGTWHWPMENVVALAHIDKKILDKAVFHLPTKTAYIMNWLITLGISPSRMVDGTVDCQVLLTPQMRCAETYFSQLEWMRESYLPEETAVQRAAVGFAYNANSTLRAPSTNLKLEIKPEAPLTVLLIERHKSRAVANMAAVRTFSKNYTREYSMRLLIHSDHDLPSLQQQMRQFAEADIVLAPHGAGLMFTTFLPYTSCVIEFTHPNNPYCYAHIAYARNLSYIMVDMRTDLMGLPEVKAGLDRCHKAVVANKLERIGGVTSLGVDITNTVNSSGVENKTDEKETLSEGIPNIVKADSVVKDVLNTLSNFVP